MTGKCRSVKVWVSLERLSCESSGQRFGPLVWYSQIGKLYSCDKKWGINPNKLQVL